MEFKQLEAFVTVIDYNGFSEAAKQLCLTQPTISTHIKSLERELNAKLISRTTKKITVTKEGEKLYDYAVSMMKLRQKILDEFNSSKKNIINIGASTIPSSYILPEILCEYRKLEPNTSFNVWHSHSEGVLKELSNGNLDIGFVGTNTNDKEFIYDPFFSDELVVAVPNNQHYKKFLYKNFDIKNLLKEPVIMRESGSGTRREAYKFIESIGISPDSLKIIASMNDQEAIKNSIANGMGISIVSSKVIYDMVKTKKIISLPIGEKETYRYLYITYKKNKILPKHVKKFIKFIKKYYKDIY